MPPSDASGMAATTRCPSLASPASVWVVGSALLLAFAGIFLSIGLLAELLTRLLHDRSASFVIAETLD